MDNKFPNGMMFVPKTPNQPDFVRGKLSVKVDDFIIWLKENKNEQGWVNIDMLESKAGKLYLKLNDFKAQ